MLHNQIVFALEALAGSPWLCNDHALLVTKKTPMLGPTSFGSNLELLQGPTWTLVVLVVSFYLLVYYPVHNTHRSRGKSRDVKNFKVKLRAS